MSAPLGNKFWLARSTHGRKPTFETPEILWDACCQYFEWVDGNPLWEMKSYMYQGAPVQDQLPKMRAMTLDGLSNFLDIEDKTWRNYRERQEYLPVVTRVEKIIRDQKFSGAAADLLNANIIARDLGLSDRQEHTGANGTPLLPAPDLSDPKVIEDVARRLAFVLSGVKKD